MPDWLLYYAVAINLYGFLLCGVDKARAVKHKKRGVRRIPERDLWLICFDRRLFWDVSWHDRILP